MWSHKQQGKVQFKSSYERDTVGERVFVLTSVKLRGNTFRRITFESW